MKLITYRKDGKTGIGALIRERILDLNDAFRDHLGGAFEGSYQNLTLDMLTFLDLGEAGLREAERAIRETRRLLDEGSGVNLLELSEVELQAPIPRPRKNIVCLGLNYAEHVREGSKILEEPRSLPSHPIFFTKPPTAVTGPYGDIVYHGSIKQLDYEVELAFVIGKDGRNIPKEKAHEHIAGYMVFQDVSARVLQRQHGQSYRGKSLDTFAPMGPYLVTADEVGDPMSLELWCKVNGETRQSANTKDMIFDVNTIVSTLSDGTTLEVGDVFATGTPSGVGAAHPSGLLKVEDVVESWVENIGLMRNKVVASS